MKPENDAAWELVDVETGIPIKGTVADKATALLIAAEEYHERGRSYQVRPCRQ